MCFILRTSSRVGGESEVMLFINVGLGWGDGPVVKGKGVAAKPDGLKAISHRPSFVLCLCCWQVSLTLHTQWMNVMKRGRQGCGLSRCLRPWVGFPALQKVGSHSGGRFTGFSPVFSCATESCPFWIDSLAETAVWSHRRSWLQFPLFNLIVSLVGCCPPFQHHPPTMFLPLWPPTPSSALATWRSNVGVLFPGACSVAIIETIEWIYT